MVSLDVTGLATLVDCKEHVILAFIDTLDSCTSVELAFESLAAHITSLGFDGIAYTVIPQTLGNFSPVFLASHDFSPGFLSHYAEAGLDKDDFTIPRIQEGLMQTLDWQHERQSGLLTKAQEDLIELASADYHIRNAVSIPTLSDKDILAGATVISSESGRIYTPKVSTYLGTVKALVFLFHCFVFSRPAHRSAFYESVIGELTADELRVAELVIEGYPLKMAETRCGISATRAGNILHDLYRRLNIRKGQQLSYLFGRHMILEIVEATRGRRYLTPVK